jgi:HEAT repeat protein
MRCFGLTTSRHRCATEAQSSTSFCAEHQSFAQDQPLIATTPPDTHPLARLLQRVRLGDASRRVPDDARFAVPRWLAKSSTPQVIEHMLNHPSCMVRWSAAFVLRRRREPVAIEPLWQVLQNDPVGFVRQQAAVALGKIGTPAALGPLIEALWHDRDAGVRQACAIALGNLGYRVAAQDLAEVLERESTVWVRWDCALALGQIGDGAVERLLAARAETDPSEVVRAACREALAEMQKRQ